MVQQNEKLYHFSFGLNIISFFVHILIITLSLSGTDIKADRFWIENYNNRIYRARLIGGHLKRRAPQQLSESEPKHFLEGGRLDAESFTILISSQEFDLPECDTISL